jgi:hypothetical protein
MSIKIYLDRIPGSPEDRNRLIGQKVKEEDDLSLMGLPMLQRSVVAFLLSRKGYSPEEMDLGKVFSINLPEGQFPVTADIIVTIEGRPFLYVKCAMSSIESWERHSFAFCRIAGPSQIPYALVTDGETARLLDIMNCSSSVGGFEIIPSRDEAVLLLKDIPAASYPPEKTEREKRILHAFDAITCP